MSEYLHYLGLTLLWGAAGLSAVFGLISILEGFWSDEFWVLTGVCLLVSLFTWPLLATLGQLQ